MILSVVVTVCHIAMANPVPDDPAVEISQLELCHEEVIAEADMPIQACTISQPALADWKAHTRFAGPQWRVKRWRCVPGHYVVKDQI